MKSHLAEIDAIPSKRIYLSIISDYHLKLALCELIDNALDNWTVNGRLNSLIVEIDLDFERQLIHIKDNSGGVKEEDIRLIVSPGLTRFNENSEIIGVFGVGSKRAVVALSEEIRIRTRYKNEKTILIELNDSWIRDEDNWKLQSFEESEDIPESSTWIDLTVLRNSIHQEDEDELREQLGGTYGYFINNGSFVLRLNGISVSPRTFDNWSYPKDFAPRQISGPIDFGKQGQIDVQIIGGLTKSHRDKSSSNEYGVYLYCNDRLVTRGNKSSEVGFRPPRIGRAHPSMSIARVIVSIKGPVMLMPWNSSKSEIDYKHETFKEIQQHIEKMLFTYVSMSKSWSGEWNEKVFAYSTGSIVVEKLADVSKKIRINLPPIPRKTRKRRYADILKHNNKKLAHRKPWTLGTFETEIAVEEILSKNLSQGNRIAMLLLDSSLEIAFKDYLVNDSGEIYSEERLTKIMKSRILVHEEIKKMKLGITDIQWGKIEHYYRLRCDLVHKRSTVSVSQSDLDIFRHTYKCTITKLFRVNFKVE